MRITIYNEYRHEREDERISAVYPEGIHACLASFLKQKEGIEVCHIANFDMPEHGLSEAVLDDTDVLVALHSAHYSKVMRRLLGTTMTLRWHHGEQERLVVTAPNHPIARGIPERFDLRKEEMYGEYFDIPRPDDVVFMGWFSGGEVFRMF